MSSIAQPPNAETRGEVSNTEEVKAKAPPSFVEPEEILPKNGIHSRATAGEDGYDKTSRTAPAGAFAVQRPGVSLTTSINLTEGFDAEPTELATLGRLDTAKNVLAQQPEDLLNPWIDEPSGGSDHGNASTYMATELQGLSLDVSRVEGRTLNDLDIEGHITSPSPERRRPTDHDRINGTSPAVREPSRANTGNTNMNWTEKNDMTVNQESEGPADMDPTRTGGGDGQASEDSRSEIQTIMEQFQGGRSGHMTIQSATPSTPVLPAFQYPPRSSSLEASQQQVVRSDHGSASGQNDPRAYSLTSKDLETSSIASVTQPPPPEPDPEPDLPFEFHRFLEQLRHRTADPVTKFLRSFLLEFGKKQWMVHEQVKIISDFLSFIGNRMAQCEVWRTVSEAEFDNAREGMEKLVMNRLYTQTFSPEILPPSPPTPRRRTAAAPAALGRKGQHQEDVERDEILAQKVRIYSWIREDHLDIRPFSDRGKKLLLLAQQELSKIRTYRAPRDKVICVLNCCKVIFGYLRNNEKDQSADSFIPILIYTVLKANPDHLVSNVQYILRFRNQEKLNGEAGYYMSSLLGAVQFIENLDRTNLTVTGEEFEKNVEAAVSTITERKEQEEKVARASSSHPAFNEKSTISRPEVTPRNSTDGERAVYLGAPSRATSNLTPTEDSEENAAVAGLLRTIQKPLSTIGRMFSEDGILSKAPVLTPHSGMTPRASPSPNAAGFIERQPSAGDLRQGASIHVQKNRLSAEDAAARQASAESAEAHRLQVAEHRTVVETLAGMFPDLDKDIISDVVREKDGRVGLAVDACLALSR